MLAKLIYSLLTVFLIFTVAISGSIIGNSMINGEDPMFTVVGFLVYLGVGILEILIGYLLFKIWS